MTIAKYYRPMGNTHLPFDTIKFNRCMDGVIEALLIKNNGTTFRATSKPFLKMAQRMATQYYTKQ